MKTEKYFGSKTDCLGIKYQGMAGERDIQIANAVLREYRGQIGTKGSRQHEDTMEVNLNKQRALDGICGHCINLIVEIHGSGPGANVSLRCRKYHSPLRMYEDTPLGQVPECADLTPPEETEVKNG